MLLITHSKSIRSPEIAILLLSFRTNKANRCCHWTKKCILIMMTENNDRCTVKHSCCFCWQNKLFFLASPAARYVVCELVKTSTRCWRVCDRPSPAPRDDTIYMRMRTCQVTRAWRHSVGINVDPVITGYSFYWIIRNAIWKALNVCME